MSRPMKDRDLKVESLRMALAMCELSVSYEHADLIQRIVNMINDKGDDASVKDCIKILTEWQTENTIYQETIIKASKEGGNPA